MKQARQTAMDPLREVTNVIGSYIEVAILARLSPTFRQSFAARRSYTAKINNCRIYNNKVTCAKSLIFMSSGLTQWRSQGGARGCDCTPKNESCTPKINAVVIFSFKKFNRPDLFFLLFSLIKKIDLKIGALSTYIANRGLYFTSI